MLAIINVDGSGTGGMKPLITKDPLAVPVKNELLPRSILMFCDTGSVIVALTQPGGPPGPL